MRARKFCLKNQRAVSKGAVWKVGLGSVFWKLITTFFQIIEFFKNKEAVALCTVSWPRVLLLSAFPSFHSLGLLPGVDPSFPCQLFSRLTEGRASLLPLPTVMCR